MSQRTEVAVKKAPHLARIIHQIEDWILVLLFRDTQENLQSKFFIIMHYRLEVLKI